MGKPLTKPAKKATLVKKVDFQWSRPVRLSMRTVFQHGSRKVTPADLQRAAQAAESAFRATLEACRPTYKIGQIDTEVEYAYVLARETT